MPAILASGFLTYGLVVSSPVGRLILVAAWGLLTMDYWMVFWNPAVRPPLLRYMTWWKWALLPFLAMLALVAERGFALQFVKGWWMVLGGLGVLWWWLA